MPRARKAKTDIDLEDLKDEEPPTIDPYAVLGIEKSATADEVKAAYRKTALKHHPDKAHESLKDEATVKFQEVAFAYAVLSDPVRRKRYDTTGSTAESISFDDFSWSEFYSEQFRDVISSDAVETFSKAYKGSDEEKDDLLVAYTECKGSWTKIYEVIMLGDPLEDEERFKTIIDAAIEEGEVEGYKAYTNETEKKKEARMKRAEKERKEAEEHAKELGLDVKLSKKGGKASGEDALAALIQKRQAGRSSFLDHLEEKYAQPKKGKRNKRASEDIEGEEMEEEDEPSEEAFQAAAARLKKGKETKANGSTSKGARKSKRTKH